MKAAAGSRALLCKHQPVMPLASPLPRPFQLLPISSAFGMRLLKHIVSILACLYRTTLQSYQAQRLALDLLSPLASYAPPPPICL